MNHLNVDKEYVQSLVEGAAWAVANITPVVKDTNEKLDESSDETEAEAHVCPLCESTLEEELSDERILEHLDSMMAVVGQVSDDLEILSEKEDEGEEEVVEEDDEEDISDLEAVLSKLNSEDLDVLASYIDSGE